jgi:hypothetical protein
MARGTIRGVIRQRVRRRRPGRGSPRDASGVRDGRRVLLLILMDLLLMGFSIVAALLAQPTLAAIAGTAFVGLARTIARRLLA